MIRLLRLGLLVSAAAATASAFALATASPAAAARGPIVGIGDQDSAMFSDPAFETLGVKHTRFVLAWDWYREPYAVAQTDAWMAAAQSAGVKPLVAFNRNWRANGHRVLPSLTVYRKSFRLLRERYPYLRDFSAWNEANHSSQPTSRKPAAAARYYNALRRDCRTCTIVAADLLDSRDMLAWVAKFKRHAPTARIWGLHNYKDANDATGATRALLGAVRGQIWLTETGGILRLKPHPGSRGDGRRSTRAKQAAAVRRVYKIAKSNRRISRIYFYEWKQKIMNRWDSAFVDAGGRLRPAYHALKRGLRASASGGAARAR